METKLTLLPPVAQADGTAATRRPVRPHGASRRVFIIDVSDRASLVILVASGENAL